MLFENRKQISAEDLMLKYSNLEEYKKIARNRALRLLNTLRR